MSTTVIEVGVDVPNANLMVIENAERFGLSQLHQLRGRVGRSSRKAFCYLMVPPGNPLTPVARRRLQAIESFSDLGSGIHIAMQDLDIRGACVIESDMELLLPAWYVPQESERISLYRELDSIEREMDLQEFRSRLLDRFGKIPPETAELMRVPRLRRLARQLGVEKVALKQGTMYLYFVDESNKAYYQSPMFGRLITYLQQNSQRVKIREKNGRRSFAIASVPTVETAVAILTEIHSLPVS